LCLSCSDEGADILILARSDARQAESLDEALWRAAAFADAGADMLFIDALASKEEMLAFTQLGGAAAGLPKVCVWFFACGSVRIHKVSRCIIIMIIPCKPYLSASATAPHPLGRRKVERLFSLFSV
jgi:hypothetical protein